MDSCIHPHFFFLYSVPSVEPNLSLPVTLALVVALNSITRYILPGNFMKISLSLFSIFLLP